MAGLILVDAGPALRRHRHQRAAEQGDGAARGQRDPDGDAVRHYALLAGAGGRGCARGLLVVNGRNPPFLSGLLAGPAAAMAGAWPATPGRAPPCALPGRWTADTAACAPPPCPWLACCSW